MDIKLADYTQNSRQSDQNPTELPYHDPIIKSENDAIDIANNYQTRDNSSKFFIWMLHKH